MRRLVVVVCATGKSGIYTGGREAAKDNSLVNVTVVLPNLRKKMHTEDFAERVRAAIDEACMSDDEVVVAVLRDHDEFTDTSNGTKKSLGYESKIVRTIEQLVRDHVRRRGNINVPTKTSASGQMEIAFGELDDTEPAPIRIRVFHYGNTQKAEDSAEAEVRPTGDVDMIHNPWRSKDLLAGSGKREGEEFWQWQARVAKGLHRELCRLASRSDY